MEITLYVLAFLCLALGFGIIKLNANYRAAEAELGQALDTIEWLEFEAELFRTEYYDVLPLVPDRATEDDNIEVRLAFAA